MADSKWGGAIRELAENVWHEDLDDVEAELRRRVEPLLRAAEKTIEFYDAHGGPMSELRKELNTWPGEVKAARVIVWFSCGAPSACAAKLALDRFGSHYPVSVVYCDTSVNEHSDNKRFAQDVERWLGIKIESIHSQEYANVDEVIEKTRYFAGVNGARCTTELKKKPRWAYQQPDDLHIWGYTVEEFERIVNFKQNNPDTKSYFILAGQGMTKEECKTMVANAGIALPVMYGLGFNNNNCIGCGKAESVEYWKLVRFHFPKIFAKRCQQSRQIGWRPLRLRKSTRIGAKRERAYLDELPEGEPDGVVTEEISCGPHCG